MKKIILLLLLPALSFAQVRVTNVNELIKALQTRKSCVMANDIDVTDVVLPTVYDTLNGGGFTLYSRRLPPVGQERFILNLNGGVYCFHFGFREAGSAGLE